MTVTVVIPALNEETSIRRCLEHVVAQGDIVSDVVVVDNNCTDATVSIAEEMSRSHPAIRVVAESEPGLSHARYAGFDAARSDVIAGIDADTVVSPGWARSIVDMFDRHPEVGAGTGPATFYDMPFQGRYRRRADAITARAEKASRDGTPLRVPQVSGANTAVRTEAWRRVRDSVSYRRDLYEDLDLSMNLVSQGWQVALIPGMRAEVSGRRMLSGPRDFLRYGLCIPRTYRHHGRPGMAALTTAIVVLQMVLNTAKLPFTRSWDPATKRFSLRRMRDSRRDIRQPPVAGDLA